MCLPCHPVYQERRCQRHTLEQLQRAASLDSGSVRIRAALTEAQLSAGQTRETFDVLRQFLETHPEKTEAYHLLSRFLLGVGAYSPAIIVLDQPAERFPDNGESWKRLASAQREFRHFTGARASSARAITPSVSLVSAGRGACRLAGISRSEQAVKT